MDIDNTVFFITLGVVVLMFFLMIVLLRRSPRPAYSPYAMYAGAGCGIRRGFGRG